MTAIKVQITDADALERVQPAALRGYLKERDWVHSDTWRDRIEIWTKTHSGEHRQVLVQKKITGRYALRVREAVGLLAELEDRSQLEVYDDIVAA